jgi:siroheme synthase (precorrin-2 oxidase/ferrochelatase)
VLGGGAEAHDKAKKLLAAGGEVTVIAQTVDEDLAALAAAQAVDAGGVAAQVDGAGVQRGERIAQAVHQARAAAILAAGLDRPDSAAAT